MTFTVLIKVVLLWAVILILAVLNGILREKFLTPSIGSFGGLIVSGLSLSILILLISYVAVPRLGPLNTGRYLAVGLIWLMMTLIFEFGFGIYVEHKPLSELLQAYSFKGGNIWPAVLATVLVAPWLAAHLRGLL